MRMYTSRHIPSIVILVCNGRVISGEMHSKLVENPTSWQKREEKDTFVEFQFAFPHRTHLEVSSSLSERYGFLHVHPGVSFLAKKKHCLKVEYGFATFSLHRNRPSCSRFFSRLLENVRAFFTPEVPTPRGPVDIIVRIDPEMLPEMYWLPSSHLPTLLCTSP